MTTNSKATIPSISPLQKLFVGAALALGVAFTASAHAPKPGTKDHNLLSPHHDFIMHMKRSDTSMGSCCSDNDAFGDLEERMTREGKYEVKITHGLDRNPLPQPVWVTIPDKAILSGRHAKTVCDEFKRTNKAAKGPDAKDTCNAPAFNVIWHNGNMNEGGKHITIWCYIPKPQLMN